MIGNINQGVDPFKVNEIPFNPFTQSKVLYINMMGPCHCFLSIAHCGTAVVVFIRNGGSLLLDIEVPQDAASKQQNVADVTCGHEFRYGGGESNRRLGFCFLGNCAPSKLDANTTKGATFLDTCGPIQVAVSNGDGCIMVRTAVKE